METIMVILAIIPFTNRRRVSFFKGNVSKETIMVISATNPFANRQMVSFFKGNVSKETIIVILETFPPHHVSLGIAARETIHPAFNPPEFIVFLLLSPCRFLRMTFFCRLRTSIQGTRKAFG